MRVTPSRAFFHCGLDYAGPFSALEYRGRGQRAQKVYIALFVCLATRAIHLELVRDYSTSAFLAAFERFTSRRGLPSFAFSCRLYHVALYSAGSSSFWRNLGGRGQKR